MALSVQQGLGRRTVYGLPAVEATPADLPRVTDMARDRDDDDDRYDDRPRERYDRPRERREGEPPPTNGAAMASLVLGLIALVVVLTAIPGLICGIMG